MSVLKKKKKLMKNFIYSQNIGHNYLNYQGQELNRICKYT